MTNADEQIAKLTQERDQARSDRDRYADKLSALWTERDNLAAELLKLKKRDIDWIEYNKAAKIAMEGALDSGNVEMFLAIKTIMDVVSAIN